MNYPTTYLQPGSTDTTAVKQLQDYLVSAGYMTQQQVNTGYGIYGPQTTAAVLKLQQANGVDNSTGPGYWGPRTIASLSSPASSTTVPVPVAGSTVTDTMGRTGIAAFNPNTGAPLGGTELSSVTGSTQPTSTGLTSSGSTPNSSSSLLAFSQALDQAVNLARKSRNAGALGLMAPYQGTMTAGDFSSILGGLNTASDKSSSKLIADAKDAFTNVNQDILAVTNADGTVTGIDKNTGQVLWKSDSGVGKSSAANNPQIIGSSSAGYYTVDPSTGTVTPLNVGGNTTSTPTISSASVTALKTALNNSKFAGPEADGKYADPNLYLQNYQSFIQAGHTAEEFFRLFPPASYINPENTWLPPEIMKFVPKPKSVTTDLSSQIDSAF